MTLWTTKTLIKAYTVLGVVGLLAAMPAMAQTEIHVDLDITTAGVQTSYEVPEGAATLNVDLYVIGAQVGAVNITFPGNAFAQVDSNFSGAPIISTNAAVGGSLVSSFKADCAADLPDGVTTLAGAGLAFGNPVDLEPAATIFDQGVYVLRVQYELDGDGSLVFSNETLGNADANPDCFRTFWVQGTGTLPEPASSLNVVTSTLSRGGVVDPTDTPTEAVVPTDTPTEAVVPTDTPTIGVLPTDTPTEAVVPTDTPTVEAGPTDTPTTQPQTVDAGAVIMDVFAGLHAVGTAVSEANYRQNAPYFLFEAARDLVVSTVDPAQALVVDLYGGVHYVNWANAATLIGQTPFYFAPTDAAVDAELSVPGNNGAYVLTKMGEIFESGAEAQAAPLDNTELLPGNMDQYYVDMELDVQGGAVAGFWLLDNAGMIHTSDSSSTQAPSLAELAALGLPSDSTRYVDLEVVMNGSEAVWITLQSDGTIMHSQGDGSSITVGDDTIDLSDIPVIGFDRGAVDMQVQPAAWGDTTVNNLPGVIMIDEFGQMHGTDGAEVPTNGPMFGRGFAKGLELAPFGD